MSKNSCHVNAVPDAVWRVISDPATYARWVVGAKEVRGADDNWPQEGSSLHHTSGAGTANVKDRTTVVESTPARHIRMRAGLRPIGVAEVVLDLRDDSGGTEVVMHEQFVEGVPAFVKPLASLALRSRNAETLRRLRELAEGPSDVSSTQED